MNVELEATGERKRTTVNSAGNVYLGKRVAGETVDVAWELLGEADHGVLNIPLPETLPKKEIEAAATKQGKTVEQYTLQALRRQMQRDIAGDANEI